MEGAVETCSITLGEHAGVISCYEGTRSCEGGAFGACGNGHTFELNQSDGDVLPASAGLRPLASAAVDCANNPCNRYCREFNEAPEEGIAADLSAAPPLSTWTTGSLSDYDPAWVVVGLQEPCQVASDCQFNTACHDPAPGSCSHSVCDSGDVLDTNCNRCATAVCAEEPNCCAQAPTCAHDPCVVGSGAPLDPACDTCVAAVCAEHPECCDQMTGSWNDVCVSYVATECEPLGQSCGCPAGGVLEAGACYLAGKVPLDWGGARSFCDAVGPGWKLLEVGDQRENDTGTNLIASAGLSGAWLGGLEQTFDEWSWVSEGVFFISNASGGSLQPGYTYENWADSEPELGAQGLTIAMGANGEWRSELQTAELEYVCEGPIDRLLPQRSPFSWGPECTALAELECGVQCPDSAPLGLGSCTARVATELDATCTDFDLAVGATCEAMGLPQVPVCNHGQDAAPAGLRLSYVPIDQLRRPAPDLSAAGECVLSEPIPPGRCVTVTDCPGLTSDQALVVNPVDAGNEDTTECRLDDNWSIYQAVPCRPRVCEANVYDAAQVARNNCGVDVENPLGIDPALATVTLGGSVVEPRCGSDETRWGSSCYLFSSEVRTWDLASTSCRERGAGWNLVALNSPAENAWVRSKTDPLLDVQIGYTDNPIEGAHVWSDGSCGSWTNWDLPSLQPNDDPPGGEQCVRMTASAGERWEDKPCNDGDHPYVCEGPVLNARGSCATGQIAGPDGSCYAFGPSTNWLTARDTCEAMGPGWRQVVVEDEDTNDFVTGLAGCTPIWLGNPPGGYANWASGVLGDLSNDPYMDELGFWRIALDGAPRTTLCQGPSVASATPALTRVNSLAECTGDDDQYYFEGNAVAPERLVLCPNTCAVAETLNGRRLEVEIPCAPPLPPALETIRGEMYYTADCEGGSPIWDFFYYDSVTPADSSIEFEIRTGPSIAELAAGSIPFLPIATARSVPDDTQRCEIDPPNCPIDIFTLLGHPAQQQQVLELQVRLVPGSSGEGPLLRDWTVRFSCPPSQ